MKIIPSIFAATFGLTSGLILIAPHALAHCEIPCGIYNDSLRIEMILEDCQTIEKSMGQIIALSKGDDKNDNQLVRWISNKEDHANKIQQIVTQYFLTQRIKPGDDATAYHQKLALLHGMLVEAMKCKQTTHSTHVQNLRQLVESFKSAYFGPAKTEDSHEGHKH